MRCALNTTKCPRGNPVTGFTLIELMIVVVIIGILSAIALPNYTNTREKAIDREAKSALKLIQSANKQYFIQGEYYYPVAGSESNLLNINRNLSIDLSGGHWIYTVTRTVTGFSATAVRSGRTWTITNLVTDATCSPAASCLN